MYQASVLGRLGWDRDWDAARAAVDADAALAAVRISSEHRGAYHASDDEGVAWAELPGRTFHRADDKRALPTVGDWALVERWADARAGRGAAVIRHVLPRRTLLVRKAAGEATAPQPLAANVDVGIVLTSANGDLVPARLDRYLGLLEDGGIAPALVLSKADLVADPAPLLDRLRAVAPGAAVIAASTVTGAGLAEIRALAGVGRTAVLLGSSGVGKSSLLNAMIGAAQRTEAIRADERGRHTTTRRELFATDAGSWIDTPGMRELAQWIDRDAPAAFGDITSLAAGCRFRDCRHEEEPGCAVRGAVPADRLASYHKLRAERAAAGSRQHAAQRLAASRKAKSKKPPPSAE